MDTLMAYHNYLQGRIKENLNSLYLGPGKFYFVISIILFIVSLISMMVGILVITLRHRHVYLVNFDYKFVGPGFIVLFILCLGVGSHFLLHAKRVTNKYRRNLRVSNLKIFLKAPSTQPFTFIFFFFFIYFSTHREIVDIPFLRRGGKQQMNINI